ncbi:hypothetical protein KY289_016769 [Solanum tuberosum]|nr:hypothetical protein KY289_016769 [Solanum tuberosum]
MLAASLPSVGRVPFRKLTPTKIQRKRELNLCFNCDEKYQKGHRYSSPPQLFLLLSEDEPLDESTHASPTSPSPPQDLNISSPSTEPSLLTISYQALSGGPPTVTSLPFTCHVQPSALQRFSQTDSISCLFHLELLSPAKTSESDHPHVLTLLLESYTNVFVSPTDLPPSHLQDQRIPLIPGSTPVNVRPYRYPHFQKSEIERLDSFVWSDAAFAAFITLKRALSSIPVLALPNFAKIFSVETDPSSTGIGAVICQEGHPIRGVSRGAEILDTPLHPIAFFSQKLSPRMQAASTYTREMFAIIEAAQKWRQYLLGRKFLIITDQQPLKALTNQVIQTPEQQRWLNKLIGFDFEILYRPDAKQFVLTCQICQQMKDTCSRPSGLLLPFPIPFAIFEDISMDFIIGLPFSHGRTVILVIVDRLSKYGHFIALTPKFTSHKIAELVYGRPPLTIARYVLDGNTTPVVADSLRQRDDTLALLKSDLQFAQACMKRYADKGRKDVAFQIGDWVLQRVALRKCLGTPDHQVTPIDLLDHSSSLMLSPESILDSRTITKGVHQVLQFLIKWQGLPLEDATHSLHQQFPDLNLEDKVSLHGGGNVTNPQDHIGALRCSSRGK